MDSSKFATREDLAGTELRLRTEINSVQEELQSEMSFNKEEIIQRFESQMSANKKEIVLHFESQMSANKEEIVQHFKSQMSSNKEEIVQHFNMVAEQMHSNLSSIHSDESVAIRERLGNHESRISRLEKVS